MDGQIYRQMNGWMFSWMMDRYRKLIYVESYCEMNTFILNYCYDFSMIYLPKYLTQGIHLPVQME